MWNESLLKQFPYFPILKNFLWYTTKVLSSKSDLLTELIHLAKPIPEILVSEDGDHTVF